MLAVMVQCCLTILLEKPKFFRGQTWSRLPITDHHQKPGMDTMIAVSKNGSKKNGVDKRAAARSPAR